MIHVYASDWSGMNRIESDWVSTVFQIRSEKYFGMVWNSSDSNFNYTHPNRNTWVINTIGCSFSLYIIWRFFMITVIWVHRELTQKNDRNICYFLIFYCARVNFTSDTRTHILILNIFQTFLNAINNILRHVWQLLYVLCNLKK